MIGWIAQNTLVALVLTAVAALGWRLYRRTPALGHAAWLLVLAVLLAPPLPVAPWKGPRDQAAAIAQSTLAPAIGERTSTLPARRTVSTLRDTASPALRAESSQLERLAQKWRREKAERLAKETKREEAPLAAPARTLPTLSLTDLTVPANPGPLGLALGTLGELAQTMIGGGQDTVRALGEGAFALMAADSPPASPSAHAPGLWAPTPDADHASESLAANPPPAAVPAPRATSSPEVTKAGWAWALAFAREALPGLWLAGSLVAALVLGSRMVRFDARLRAGRREADSTLESIVAGAASRIGVRTPRVWIVEGIGTPMVWALGRPRLIWPAGCNAPGLSTGDRAVIAHELAHIRRRDHWCAWVEVAALVVLWWHPLAHLARRRLRIYAELAADAWVVWAHPRERRAYADALIDTAARARFARPAPAALGVVDSRTRAFHRRLRMIMSATTSRTVRPLVAVSALLLAAGLLPTWSGASSMSPAPALEFARQEPRVDGRILPHLRAKKLESQAERAAMGDGSDRAAALFREIAALRPDDAHLRERLGRMRYDVEDWQGAYDGWSAAAELDPSDGKSAYNAACAAALLGERDRAMNWLDRALRAGFDMSSYIENDSDLDSLRKGDRLEGIMASIAALEEARETAEEAEDEGRWAEALQAYERAADIASRSEEDLSNLAMACYHAKEWTRAEAAFRRLADLSDDSDMLYNRACVLALAGEKNRALDALEDAFRAGYSAYGHARTDSDLASIQSEPRFAEMLTRLSRPERLRREAQLAMEFADYAGAVSRYREAAADGAATEEFRRSLADGLGMAELRAGNYREAARVFREQAAAGDNLTNALYNVACGLALAGDESEALQYLEASIEAGWSDAQHMLTDADLDPLRAEPEFERLVIAAADQQLLDAVGATDWDDAEAAGRAMLEEDPTSGAGHLRVGLALMRRGSADEALKHFQAQAKSGSMVYIAHYNMACAYAHMNKKDLAFAALEDAAEAGFDDSDHFRYDLDLKNLFDDPRFEAFLERVERGEFGHTAKSPSAFAPAAPHNHAGGIAVVAPAFGGTRHDKDHDHDTVHSAGHGAGHGDAHAPAAPTVAGGGSGGSVHTGPAATAPTPSAPKPKKPRKAGGPG